MSAMLMQIGDNLNAPNTMRYQIVSASELSDIDVNKCAVGSIAHTQDFAHIWNLGEDKQWHEV